jgi:hypothetical protein
MDYPNGQEFLVKAILDEKTFRGRPRYMVKYEVRHMGQIRGTDKVPDLTPLLRIYILSD